MPGLALLPFIVTNGLRLGMASARAYEQHIRDRAALFPDAEMATWAPRQAVLSDFTGIYGSLVGPDGRLQHLWSEVGPKDDDCYAQLEVEWITLRFADKGANAARAEMLAASVKLQQWEAGAGPNHPFVQIALTLVDIGLDFVAAYPALVGLDGAGGKLIAGVARRLSDIVPEDTANFAVKSGFANRLLAVVLRSGLAGLSENVAAVIGEEHLQALLVEGLAPVIAALPDDINERAEWRRVAEAVAGPAFQAALGVMARQPQAFHGDLDTGKAAGAIVQAVLLEATASDLETVLSPAGLQRLVGAAVGVVAARPELFAKRSGAKGMFERDLLRHVARTVATAPRPLTGDVAAAVAAAAMDALKDHAPLLLDADDDWDEVVRATTDMVIDGLKAGIIEPHAGQLEKIFTSEKLVELARVVVAQVAANPRLVVGKGSGGAAGKRNQELQNVVAAVAAAMAADAKLLLTADDWIAIAGVALEEISDNPGRLVGLEEGKAGSAILSGLLTTVIGAAAKGVDAHRREPGRLAFGRTLRDTLIASIRAATAGAATLAEPAQQAEVGALVDWLTGYTQEHPDKVGSRQWLKLYKALLPSVLAGAFRLPSPADIETILAEA